MFSYIFCWKKPPVNIYGKNVSEIISDLSNQNGGSNKKYQITTYINHNF